MDESEGAIYVPPKDGLPFLVVTFADGDMQAQPTSTRSEARVAAGAADTAGEPCRRRSADERHRASPSSGSGAVAPLRSAAPWR